MSTTICEDCGKEYGYGQWPFCNGTGDHGIPMGLQTFHAYVDEHMLDHPVEITSWKERNNLLKSHGLKENEPPSPSKLAERKDRVQWQEEVKQRHRRESM
jgi:hypothetical protein